MCLELLMDCLIIGGGVIGLSLAYELTRSGLKVRLIERGTPGQEASWAGAGILPPAIEHASDSYEQLLGLSNRVHTEWAQRLLDETSIDNGYRQCGGVYLAEGAEDRIALDKAADDLRSHSVRAIKLSADELRQLEPALRLDSSENGWHLPDEAQIRNPRHLKSLVAACSKHGVEISSGVEAEDFEIRGGRVEQVLTTAGPMTAGAVCITTGSFSRRLIRRLGVQIAIKPIRGQMALLSCGYPLIKRIINVGKRYVVPRADGRVLIGSTEEDVGFDRRTNSGAIADLLRFAHELVPQLADAPLERCWAGLRPATHDGLPYLGEVCGTSNAFVAAGHFRSGLQLSTGTAVVMSQLVRGQKPEIDLAPFRVGRD
jgi:glycine oxidase